MYLLLLMPAAVLLASGALTQSAAPEPMKERSNMRNLRYCEILVVNRHGFSATASVYNTVGLNDCPEQQWKALSANKLKAERNAYTVIMNGPRYFMMDRNALQRPGDVSDFDGLQARLLATVDLPAGRKRTSYTETTVNRVSQYVYEAGKNVYELFAPDGRGYILQFKATR